MDAINFGDDVFTFVVGKPSNPLQSGYSTIRNMLVPIWSVIYSCVYTFPDKDYLLCIVLNASEHQTENSSKDATHFIYNVDGKFSIHPNLPYITNACKKQIWWSMNLTFLLCSFLLAYPIILLFVRRGLDYYLDFGKGAVLNLVADLDRKDVLDLLQDADFGDINVPLHTNQRSEDNSASVRTTSTITTTTSSWDAEKINWSRIIEGIENQIDCKRVSFHEHDKRRIVFPGRLGHLIVFILLGIYLLHRLNRFFGPGFLITFICQQPGILFPDNETMVECSINKDWQSSLLFFPVTAFCYIILDWFVCEAEWRSKNNLWQLLSKSPVEVDDQQKLSTKAGDQLKKPTEVSEHQQEIPKEAVGRQQSSAEVIELTERNLRYIIGCRRDVTNDAGKGLGKTLSKEADNQQQSSVKEETSDACSSTTRITDHSSRNKTDSESSSLDQVVVQEPSSSHLDDCVIREQEIAPVPEEDHGDGFDEETNQLQPDQRRSRGTRERLRRSFISRLLSRGRKKKRNVVCAQKETSL